ncbi:MAG: hypothetical protein IJ123_09875 [Blautia sp.]|nr:hypothetical protein [Blautia sp.]
MSDYYTTIRAAGHVIRIGAMFIETCTMLRRFAAEEAEPEITIEMDKHDIRIEWKRMLDSGRYETDFVNRLPGYYFESFALNRRVSDALLPYYTLAFHGSAVVVDGRCFIFSAASGTGKSTYARMWAKHFGSRAYILNDDKPFLKVSENNVTVYGSPWDGKHHNGRNAEADLAAIVFLDRADRSFVTSVLPEQGLERIRWQVFRPDDPEDFRKADWLLERTARIIPFYNAGFTLKDNEIEDVYRMLCPEGR